MTLRAIAEPGWISRLFWRCRRRRIRVIDLRLRAPVDTPLFVEPNNMTAWLHGHVDPVVAQTANMTMTSPAEITAAHLARTLGAGGRS